MSTAQKSAKGTITKRVSCESCGCSYQYEMTRIVFAKCSNELATQNEVDAEAQHDAEVKLNIKLTDDCDVVACPSCGAITQAMKARRRGFFVASFACIGIGAGALLIVFVAMLLVHRVYIFPAVVGFGMLLLGAFVLLFGSWRMLLPRKGRA